VPGRGRIKSPEYRDWQDAAGWRLKEQRARSIVGHVAFKLHVGLSKKRRDLDNYIKPTLDLLVLMGVIEDDSKVADIAARWDRDLAADMMVLHVRRMQSPERRVGSRSTAQHAKAGRARANQWVAVNVMGARE
jgi:Holliday junction resolvase RusA-like endonuclease